MKKYLSSLLAVLVLGLGLLPANATLTNSSTNTRYMSNGFLVDSYAALITATANDTTANADSSVISNVNGDVKSIAAGVSATNQTGSSPTLTVSLLGSFSTSGPWFTIQTTQGSTAGTTSSVATSALSISTASTTNVATGLDTFQFALAGITYPYLKVRVAVGGTGSPGWTGVAYAVVRRQGK